MTVLRLFIDGFFRWIDSVAATTVAMLGRLAARRGVRLVEEDNGAFVIKGAGRDGSSGLPLQRLPLQLPLPLPPSLRLRIRLLCCRS